eukprot:m.587978 g.587978  ORF g.587978 m.587978 type:complete len:96 (+) comp57995_c1_seq2:279-566(+)
MRLLAAADPEPTAVCGCKGQQRQCARSPSLVWKSSMSACSFFRFFPSREQSFCCGDQWPGGLFSLILRESALLISLFLVTVSCDTPASRSLQQLR